MVGGWQRLGGLGMLVVALVGCDFVTTDDWLVEDVELVDDALHYVAVQGTVTANTPFVGFGTTATVAYYADQYVTLIDEIDRSIGTDLEEAGESQLFDLSSLFVYIKPASGGFDRVCVELTVEDSNYAETQRIGCINGSD